MTDWGKMASNQERARRLCELGLAELKNGVLVLKPGATTLMELCEAAK